MTHQRGAPISCEGPLIWFDVDSERRHLGAVLECARPACGYITTTGSFFDRSHADSEILREGLDTN